MTWIRVLAAMVAALFLAALVAAFFLVGSARAQTPTCIPYPMMVSVMEKLARTSIGKGLDGRGVVIEVFVGADGKFAVISTAANGVSCLASIGDGWESEKAAAPGKES